MASNRIKGITIEIGGTTKGLQDALKGANKTISTTQSKLRDVKKLLKLDPKNTELLSQKQRTLKDAISGTKDKLDSLKLAQEQAAEKLKNGDLGQDQYDALQREIIETEANLRSLEEQAASCASTLGVKIAGAGESITSAGEKMEAVGGALTKGVTAPIIGVAAASAAAWSEVDEGLDTLITKTGATGEALESMSEIVKEIPQEINVGFDEAGAAVGGVNTRFGATGEELKDLSAQFLKFAQINGTDVSSTIDTTQKAMAAFGLETEDAGAFLDTLNAVGQRTGVDLMTLTSSMTTNATALQEMGLNASDAANFLGDLEVSGIDSGTAMTGLKKALQTAAKQGKPMDQALSEIQTAMEGAESSEEAMQTAMELFGSKAGPAIAKACRDGKLNFEALGSSLEDNVGSVSDTFEATQDPIDKFKTTMNTLKVTGAELFDVIGEMLTPVLQALAAKAKQLREWWKGLSSSQKQLGVRFAAVAAAAGPVLTIFGKFLQPVGKLVTKFGGLMSKVKSLGGPLKALKAVFAGISAPAAAVAGVIAVLGAAFVTLWKNNEDFRDKILSIWDGIRTKFGSFVDGMKHRLGALGISTGSVVETLKGLWNGFCSYLAPVFETAFQLVSITFSTVLDVITGIWDTVSAAFRGDWEGVWNGISGIFGSIWDGIKAKFETILGGLKDAANVVLSWFGTDWDTVWTGIKDFFETTLPGAWSVVTGIFEGIGTWWTGTVWPTAQPFLETVWETFGKIFTETIPAAWDTAKAVFEGIGTWWTGTVWPVAQPFLETAWNGLKTIFEETIPAAWETLKGIFDGIGTWWEGVKEKAPGFFGDAWEGIKTAISGVKEGWDALKLALGGLGTWWDGVKKNAGGFIEGTWTKIKNGIGGIPDAWSTMKEKLGDMGTWWGTVKSNAGGFIEGTWTKIKNGIGGIPGKWAEAKASFAGLDTWWSGIKEAGGDFFGGAWDSLVEMFTTGIPNAWQKVKDAFADIGEWWAGVKAAAGDFFGGIWKFFTGDGESQDAADSSAASWDQASADIAGAFTDMATAAGTNFGNLNSTALTTTDSVTAYIKSAWLSVKTAVTVYTTTIKTTCEAAWTALQASTATAWATIKRGISGMWVGINAAISAALTTAKTNISVGWTSITTTTASSWSTIKRGIDTTWTAINASVSTSVASMQATVSTGMTDMSASITSILSSISQDFTSTFANVKATVSEAVSAIQGAFNFTWSLPYLKLPHIYVSGGFSLDPPSAPTFSVDWYKKAMDGGMILNSPTIFGMKNGKLLGAGEAGSEAIVGTQSLMGMIREAVAGAGSTSQKTVNYGGVEINITAPQGMDVRSLAREIKGLITDDTIREGAHFA